ncbi:WD40-repeat-containing domain protein [Kalaharituber pfeilii]|nr:WD40-repeat-containing domain protein [Kalaharituber pfeilii]
MMGLNLYKKWVPNVLLGFPPHDRKTTPLCRRQSRQPRHMGRLVHRSELQPPEDDTAAEDDNSLPAISNFKIHARSISSFTFSPFSLNTLFTSSYDGSIRSFDLAKGISSEVFVADDDEGISGVEIHDNDPYTIYFSTLEGRVGRKDTRLPVHKAEVWTLSDKKIGGFSVHPVYTHLCATASLDRTLKIWDLRKIEGGKGVFGTGKGRMPALIGQHTSRLSVSSAYWNRNGTIATTSYDDTVKLYKFPNAGSWAPGVPIVPGGSEEEPVEIEPTATVKHNNQTGRWVTILRAQWHQRPSDGNEKLVIGNMNRFLDIYAEDGTQLAQLGHEELTAVPAAAKFHPTENWVAGGTASGKVALFI